MQKPNNYNRSVTCVSLAGKGQTYSFIPRVGGALEPLCQKGLGRTIWLERKLADLGRNQVSTSGMVFVIGDYSLPLSQSALGTVSVRDKQQ